MKLGHFLKYIRNTWEILKRGAVKGWRRSVGPILWKKEILRRVAEDILHRTCFLKYVLKGKIYGRTEVTGRGGRRRNKLQGDLKEIRGLWGLKEETLDCFPLWRRLLTCRKTDYGKNEQISVVKWCVNSTETKLQDFVLLILVDERSILKK